MNTNPTSAIVVDPFALLFDCITEEDLEYRGRNSARLLDKKPSVFSQVKIETGIDWMYTALSHPATPKPYPADPYTVGCFEAAHFSAMTPSLPTGDVMYVDENGLFTNNPLAWIIVRGAWQPFSGKGLIVGTDHEGDTIPPQTVDIPWLEQNVMVIFDRFVYIPSAGTHATLINLSAIPHVPSVISQLCNPDHSFWASTQPR